MHRPTPTPTLRTLSLTLALGVLVALYGAGAAHAQTPPEPEACADPPADEVSSSLVNGSQKHLALFDVYWDNDDDALDPNSKTLINNPCPPLVVHTTRTEDDGFGGTKTITTTTRAPSNVNIGHTIIHIPSSDFPRAAEGDTSAVLSFKRTVTASGGGDYGGADYAFLRPLQDDGTRAASADVWIVPACEEEEEVGTPARTALDPPFCLGFSAGLLNPEDWSGDIQYEFEAIREPGHATGDGWGDFFVFHVENGTPNVIWRTDDADTNVYNITPGTYDHAFWAFTKPGTYVFHVHAKGHPNLTPGIGLDPLIKATTVSSEVRQYTFHVGDLNVNHNPIFELERSVTENSNAGTNVGAPILVKDLDEEDTLCFALHGHGVDNFTIKDGTTDTTQCGTLTAVNKSGDNPISVQIQVKADANLYAGTWLDEDTNFYDLTLHVSDGKDHEGNNEPASHKRIDDNIAVAIDVIDDGQTPISLTANHTSSTTGNYIELTAAMGTWPAAPGNMVFLWVRRPQGGEIDWHEGQGRDTTLTQVTSQQAGTYEYAVRATYFNGSGMVWKTLESNWLAVTWTAPQPE